MRTLEQTAGHERAHDRRDGEVVIGVEGGQPPAALAPGRGPTSIRTAPVG